MDCYIIASTLEGGWWFNILQKEARIDEGRTRRTRTSSGGRGSGRGGGGNNDKR